MSKTNHTPAPWTFTSVRWTNNPMEPLAGWCITAEGKTPYVASVNVAGPNHAAIVSDELISKGITTGFSAAEAEANGRLMAASPIMFDALTSILADCGDTTITPTQIIRNIIDKAKAAMSATK